MQTEDNPTYFKFEDEFSSSLELFTVQYEEQEYVINGVVSFNPPVNESEHIIEKDDIGKVVTTTDGVLLGKMSFKMNVDEFDVSGFSLVTDTNSPTTGIKINLNVTEAFENPSTFRFTDQTASKDAYLSNIVVSSGEVDNENPGNSTYKEYTLTPTFDKDTLNYEIELLEYIDTIDIKATQNDSKATMKIKVPKRDAENNLVYDTDGITIIYEEKDLESDIPLEVTINKLGEPDTNITVIVTAEDGKTVNNYELVIKRPYGTIKGSIYIDPMATKGIYKSNIRVYNSNDVSTIIDWSTLVSGASDKVHENLLTLKSQDFITNDDGTYEIYVIPGTYDILLDKDGYLDHIYTSKLVNNGDIVDLGYKELYAGDFNKDGCIQIVDMAMILNVYGTDSTSSDYKLEMDFNEDGQIQIFDLSVFLRNYNISRIIE